MIQCLNKEDMNINHNSYFYFDIIVYIEQSIEPNVHKQRKKPDSSLSSKQPTTFMIRGSPVSLIKILNSRFL